MLTLRSWAASAALLLLLGGCLFPSDPAGPPVGIRVDAGVLTIYVPLCPGESIIGATIDEFDDDGDGVQAWTARSPRMATQKRVTIDAAAWQNAEGAFTYSGQEFSVEIDATTQRYGASVLNPRRISATLPADKYDVDGTELSSGDLDKLAECADSDGDANG